MEELYVFGTGNANATHYYNTCFALRDGDQYFMVDAGGGNGILRILEDGHILKIGADVAGDLRALHGIRHFREAGFIDLQALVSEWGVEEKSLRKMSAIVLGQRVSKAQRLSNWEAAQLTSRQQLYAATDAWVCTLIYDRLQHTPKPKSKPRRTHDTANLPAQG